MVRKIVVVDTETGGIDPARHAIMSVSMILHHGGGVDDTLDLLVYDPTGEVTQEALTINGIDPAEWKRTGLSPAQAVDRIESFLLKNDLREPRKVTLGGCQTAFDVGFLKRLYSLAGRENYDKVYSRRLLDISPVALALDQAERIDLLGGEPSLENIARVYGVGLDRSKGHKSIDDALATSTILGRMVAQLRASASQR